MRDKITVGLYRQGGIGDTIFLSAFAKAIRGRYFPCHITAYTRPDMVSVLDDTPDIDKVLPAPCLEDEGDSIKGWHKDVKVLNTQYEVFYDCRYITKVYFHNPMFEYPIPKIDGFDKLFNSFTYSNRFLAHYGINTFSLPFLTTNLRATPDDMWIKTVEPDDMVQGEYIVLHTDSSAAPVKSWFIDYWVDVAEWLMRKPIKVVLVGKLDKHKIPCTVDYRNKLTLHETAHVIKNAKLLVGTEGGLIHVARAVGTKCIVLFGPTSPSLFGYPENTNLQVGNCKNCFGQSGWWFWSCLKFKYSKCMRQITPEIVKACLKSFLGEVSEPEIEGGDKLLRRE